MPSIGTVQFVSLGELTPVSEKSEIVTRPNIDGVSIRKGETRGDLQQLTGFADIIAADANALKTQLDVFMNLTGTTATITTDGGVARANVFIKEVRIPLSTGRGPNPRKVPVNVGGINGTNATHVVTVNLFVIDTSLAP